ncbi:MAG: hypothetical protein ACK4LQ_07585 [Pararhodobacter sp.]
MPLTAGAETLGARLLACEAERGQPGCATLLVRLFVCDQAGVLPGCADLLAARDAALAEAEDMAEDMAVDAAEVEPEVTPRAEGELDGADQSGEAVEDATEADSAEAALPACPVLEATGWHARVAPVEGEEGLQLIVEGTVLLPTPGYAVMLTPGMADRSAQPVQVINLRAQAPGGMVAQVLSVYDLRLVTPSIGQAEAGQAPYRGVRVLCGDTELAFIEAVELAE